MEKFVDLLKIIAEKYLVQTIASVALAILGVAFIPNLFGMTDKVGKTLYSVLIFCVSFLLIQCAKHIYATAKKIIEKKRKKKLSDELSKKEVQEHEEEVLEELWDYVDSLSPQDKHYLVEFLKNGNQPIEVMGEHFGIGLLNNNNIVACMEKQQKCAPAPSRKIEFDGHLVFPQTDISYMAYSSPTKLYRLKDNFFELLNYSYEKYKRISHFDMEEENDG